MVAVAVDPPVAAQIHVHEQFIQIEGMELPWIIATNLGHNCDISKMEQVNGELEYGVLTKMGPSLLYVAM